MRGGKLTPRQERFCEEYLVDLNATEAARRAGYKGRYVQSVSSRLLMKSHVLARIAALKQARAVRTGVAADNVLIELLRLGKSDIGDILDFTGERPRLKPPHAIGEDARRCISSIKVKRRREGNGPEALEVEVIEFRLWSKPDALDKLCKHLDLYTERPPPEVPTADVISRINHLAEAFARNGRRAGEGGPGGNGTGEPVHPPSGP